MSRTAALTPPRGSTLREVPGDPGPPVVGHSLAFLRDPLAWSRSRYTRYGPVSWTRAFGTVLVGLMGADANEVVLLNRDRVFSQQGWEYFIGRFFTRGLMLLDFDEHLHHRRIMQHAFTRPRLRGYAEQMAPVIARGVTAWTPSERFLVYPALKQLTLDVATTAFVGMPLGADADLVNEAFSDVVRAGTALVRTPVPGGRWRRGLRGRRVLDAYFRDALPQKRVSRGDDLFTALCSAESPDGDVFGDDDVVNHMVFLMMAAHDTVTITLTTMFYELARHPQWQERARDESMTLGTDELGFDDLDALGTLDLVMRECIRLVAPVPSLPRLTVRDTDLLGYHIPRGTMVDLFPTLTHRLDAYWTRPDDFDPLRFSSARREDEHPGAYVPFGGGVHRCIGMHFAQMEVKAVMHRVLRSFRWSVDRSYVMPLDTTALPRPADDLPVRLHRITYAAV